MKLLGPFFAVALGAYASAAQGQSAVEQMARFQGVVSAVRGDVLVVAPKNGEALRVQVGPDTQLLTSEPVDVSAIQPGRYVGTANLERADGSGVSAEVHIFADPEPGPGMNAPWGGGMTMTNGAVASVRDTPNGPRLQISYGAGDKAVIVPPGTPIVLLAPTVDRALLKPGAVVKGVGAPRADGALTAAYLTVEAPGAHAERQVQQSEE